MAGATAARELASRSSCENRGTTYGRFLARLAVEIDEDRSALLEIMGALSVRTDPLKVLGGWGAEKLGRLKLNGRLLGYSPLSRVVELEGLVLGVRGKLALWRVLAQLEQRRPQLAGFELEELIGRAERQLDELEVHRLQAAAESFS